MTKDVHLTTQKIAEREGGMWPEGAEECIGRLKDQHHYHRDAY
jgi:sulfite reductase alpha subunit-like flavoprotein